MGSYIRMLAKARRESVGSYPGTLEVGELVRLKSGGPVMTVAGVAPDGQVLVAFADRGGVVHTDSFAPELLRRHENVVRRWAS